MFYQNVDLSLVKLSHMSTTQDLTIFFFCFLLSFDLKRKKKEKKRITFYLRGKPAVELIIRGNAFRLSYPNY